MLILSRDWSVFFCFSVWLFSRSIFISPVFWSTIYCILLKFVLADKNIKEEIGSSIVWSVQCVSFCLPKSTSTQDRHDVFNKCAWNYLEHKGIGFQISNNHPKDVKIRNFAKRSKQCEFLSNSIDEEEANLVDHICAKTQDLVDIQSRWWFVCLRYSDLRKTTFHTAERMKKMFDKNAALEIYIFKYEMYCLSVSA